MLSNRANALSVIRLLKIEGPIFMEVDEVSGRWRGGGRSYTVVVGAANKLTPLPQRLQPFHLKGPYKI